MRKDLLVAVGMFCGTILACCTMYSTMLVKLMKPTNQLIKKSERLFDYYLKSETEEFDD